MSDSVRPTGPRHLEFHDKTLDLSDGIRNCIYMAQYLTEVSTPLTL